jgi:hypothetical protein
MLFAAPSFFAQSDEGRAYFHGILDAYGSTGTVQSLHTYHLRGTLTVIDGDREGTGQVEIFYKKPDRYKRLVTLGADTEVIGLRGNERYRFHSEAGAVTSRNRPSRREGNQLVRFLDGEICNVLAIPLGTVRMDLKPDTVWVDGVECEVLKIAQSRSDSAWIRLLVDCKTHLIRRVEMYLDDVTTGQYTERWLEFSEYAARGGIQFPGVIWEYTNGELSSVIQVESIEFNISLSDNILQPE